MAPRRKALLAGGVLLAGTLALATIASGDVLVADARIYTVEDAPPHETAIVLSCAPGPLLAKRMDAACALVTRGAARRLLLSGMPYEMPYMRERARACLPDAAILVDDGAKRTLENLRRARDRFGVERALLVTQRFHVGRALYLADALGLEATGVLARGDPRDLRGRLRERLARLRARIDVALLEERPE